MLCQQVKQGELGSGQIQYFVTEAGFLAARVKLEFIHHHHGRVAAAVALLLLLTPVGAAQNRAYTRHQLAIVKRFRQIVICAEFESQNAVKVAAARGQHNHRGLVVLAQFFQGFNPVFARHHNVEQ